MVREYEESEIPAVYNLQDVPAARDEEGITQKIFRGLDLMVGFTTIESDQKAAPHAHPWEQVNMLVDGELDFYVGGEIISLEAFDILEIPPGIEHTARSISNEPAVLLAFWPLREDRLVDTDYQREFPSNE